MVYDSIGRADADWAGKPYEAVREVAGRDGSILVLPVGSLEQHGHHLPTATDTILVDAVAHGATERTDLPVLLAPPLWTGHSPHHMSLGGTVTADFDTLLALLEDVADAALENPFDALLLLNGHGGNRSLVGAATSTIGHEHPSVEVLGLTYFELGASFVEDLRESDIGGIVHGGELETALMMHLRPDLVREDHIEGTHLEGPYDLMSTDLMEGGPLAVQAEMDEYSETGAIGDPQLATPEMGAEAFDRYNDALADLLERVHDRVR